MPLVACEEDAYLATIVDTSSNKLLLLVSFQLSQAQYILATVVQILMSTIRGIREHQLPWIEQISDLVFPQGIFIVTAPRQSLCTALS